MLETIHVQHHHHHHLLGLGTQAVGLPLPIPPSNTGPVDDPPPSPAMASRLLPKIWSSGTETTAYSNGVETTRAVPKRPQSASSAYRVTEREPTPDPTALPSSHLDKPPDLTLGLNRSDHALPPPRYWRTCQFHHQRT